MKNRVLFAAVTLPFLLSAVLPEESTLSTVRSLYFEANSEYSAKIFLNYALSVEGKSALIIAYKGTATAMSAGYSEGLLEKFRLFRNGREQIESAVAQSPLDPEIRFLRYSIQANVPSILGYSGDMEEDFGIFCHKLGAPGNSEDGFWQKAKSAIMLSSEVPEHHRSKLRKL